LERQRLVNKSFAGFIADADGKKTFLKTLPNGRSEKNGTDLRNPGKKKDGTVFWAQLQSIVQENTEEKAGDIQTMIMDVTDHKKAADRIGIFLPFPNSIPIRSLRQI